MEDFIWSASYAAVPQFVLARSSQSDRNRADLLSNEVREQTKYGKLSSDIELGDRISNVSSRQQQLQDLIRKIDIVLKIYVSQGLQENKSKAEAFIEELRYPWDVVISTRKVREASHVLGVKDDPVIKELIKEQSMIEESDRKGKKMIFDCRMALASLLECQEALKRDAARKLKATQVDSEQLLLDEFSSKISFKPDPLRFPEGAHDRAKWLYDFDKLVRDAEAKLKVVERLQEDVQRGILEGRMSIGHHQQTVTDMIRHLLRKIQEAIDEILYQLSRINREIDALTQAIEEQEAFLRGLKPSAKLIETRLENRSFKRPIMGERTEDEAQTNLKGEWHQMQENSQRVAETIKQLKEKLKTLLNEKDLNEERLQQLNSLAEMERQCLNVRQRLQNKPAATIVLERVLPTSVMLPASKEVVFDHRQEILLTE